MGKRKTGRPLKLLQRIDPGQKETYQDRLLSALKAGSFFDDACAYAGVSKSAAYEWLAKGRAARDLQESKGEQYELPGEDRIYLEFTDAVERARAGAVIGNLAIIRTAAQNGQWQAAAWWLERTAPEKYGRHDRKSADAEEISTEKAREQLAELNFGDQ